MSHTIILHGFLFSINRTVIQFTNKNKSGELWLLLLSAKGFLSPFPNFAPLLKAGIRMLFVLGVSNFRCNEKYCRRIFTHWESILIIMYSFDLSLCGGLH